MYINIIITPEDIEQFKRSQEHYFSNRDPQPGPLSWDRKKLTNLSVNKYIYIYDHYDELKRGERR